MIKRQLFLVSTPYQIFNAIAVIRMNDYRNCDIYVLQQFSGAVELIDKLKESGLFNIVRLVKYNRINKGNKFLRYSKKIIKYPFYYQIAKKYFELDLEYENVYLTCPDIIFEFAIAALKKRNKKLSVNYYEDGTFSYIKSEDNLNAHRGQYIKFLSKVIAMPNAFEKIDKFYVYEPQVAALRSNGEVKDQLAKINREDLKWRLTLNHIFSYHSDYNIKDDIIFLEQPYEGNLDNFEHETFFNIISYCKGGEDIIVKLHPRTRREMFSVEGVKIYEHQGIPWEMICLNNNMNKKLIITFSSSAAFTSKFIFDDEPYVLFLINLYPNIENYSTLQNLIDKLVFTYRDKQKICVPKSETEIYSFIDNYRNNIGELNN